MTKLTTFDDWVDLFNGWKKDIGYDGTLLGDYKIEPKFGDLKYEEIEFGDYAGTRKWEALMEIPDQRIRDGLLHLITYQGDTEFASVEQQRNLIETAPSDYDLQSLIKVNREEMRHGMQMCYLLVNYFGTPGKIEAQKMLDRRAYKKNRLLGAFNGDVNNWVDFFTYTDFVDRDGKYQLTMLSHSGFAPLARSMTAMLKEEFYHLLTGQTGLLRIIKAGKIPVEIVQKYLNKWIPMALDLFGTNHSSTAHWAYVWGLKGRYDEAPGKAPADKERLNEAARNLYVQEVAGLVAALNKGIPAGQLALLVPDDKFRREIGEYAGKPYSVRGELLSPEAYEQHLREALPGAKDEAILSEVFKGKDWITPVSQT
ncbi:MAG TPA: Phenylacetic acid catabolic protein [Methylomirabilota bacterium]|nr:Phenylacetic acid catabolic protein [Methylomirabilota bacterium]